MRKIFAVFVIVFAAVSFSYADLIILKDGQKFNADVKSFDNYYVTVNLSNNKTIAIPWGEIRLINHDTTEADWREETYMNNEDTEVTTLVTPVSVDSAFINSLFPGFVIHGSGHFYGKDQNTGMSLMSAEIVSVIIMAISGNGMLNSDPADASYAMSKIVFFTGLTMFTASWGWDIAFSRRAAEDFNSKHEFMLPQVCDVSAVDSQANTTTVLENK